MARASFKTQIRDQLREAIRQARIERDNGNDAAHDRVMYLNGLLNTVAKLNQSECVDFATQRGIELED